MVARGPLLLLCTALGGGCHQDDVKMIDVPPKDIPKEMYNKPIPPEAFKTMPPAVRQAAKKGKPMFSHGAEGQSR
jgi:hypothetical protein